MFVIFFGSSSAPLGKERNGMDREGAGSASKAFLDEGSVIQDSCR